MSHGEHVAVLQVVQKSDIVFIAVKPQYVSVVMKEVKPYLTDKHILVSIAAGITLATLKVTSPLFFLPTPKVTLRSLPLLPPTVTSLPYLCHPQVAFLLVPPAVVHLLDPFSLQLSSCYAHAELDVEAAQ